MEAEFNTGNILNSYVTDNYAKFKNALRQTKNPHQAIAQINADIYDKLGFSFCEALDDGCSKGEYNQVKAHWFKKKEHALLWAS